MADNYLITAKRMGQSSTTLHDTQDFYNACYLAGYVIECFNKILIQRLGARPKHIHNIPDLITKVEQEYLANSSVAALIVRSGVHTDLRIAFAHINSGWNPLKRYDDSQQWDAPTSNHYQKEVILALKYLAKLELDGVI